MIFPLYSKWDMIQMIPRFIKHKMTLSSTNSNTYQCFENSSGLPLFVFHPYLVLRRHLCKAHWSIFDDKTIKAFKEIGLELNFLLTFGPGASKIIMNPSRATFQPALTSRSGRPRLHCSRVFQKLSILYRFNLKCVHFVQRCCDFHQLNPGYLLLINMFYSS